MATEDRCGKEVFVTYLLEKGRGLYDKHGLITEEENNIIKFKTKSERYRILDEEHIERKQRCGWYRLGTIKHLAVRECPKDYFYDG